MGKVKRLHNASERNPVDKLACEIDEHHLKELHHTRNSMTTKSVGNVSTLDLIASLGSAPTLTAQIKLCQEFKSKFRPTLLSRPLPMNAEAEFFLLFMMYLSPKYVALRSSLDWLMETSTLSLCNQYVTAIKQSCLEVMKDIVSSTFTAVSCKEAGVSMVQIAILDRESQWMDQSDSSLNIAMSSLSKLLSICVTSLCATDTAVESMSMVSDSGVLYAEASGEFMKCLAIVLKTRKERLLSELHSELLTHCTISILKLANDLLRSEYINRDVITAISIGVVSLVWAHRASTSEDSLANQLYSLLMKADPLDDNHPLDPLFDLSFYAANNVLISLIDSMPTFPVTSRCELFRAAMSVFPCSMFKYCPNNTNTTGIQLDNQLVFGCIYETALALTSNSLPTLRFGGLQMFETWFSLLEQLEACTTDDTGLYYYHTLKPKVLSIGRLLSIMWSHPSKLINHLVPVVYQRLVDYLARSKLLRFVDKTLVDDVWKALIAEALSQPPHHRGRYQSITILLPKISPELFITSQPNLVQDLVAAACTREVSSSATKLLGTLLKYLRDREAYSVLQLRALWDVHVARALCSDTRNNRVAAAEYLLAELLKVDDSCGPHIIACIRSLRTKLNANHALFAMMHVVLQCRLLNTNGLEIKETDSTTDPSVLTMSELRLGCINGDADVRLTALYVIVASHKPNTPFPLKELDILKETFSFSIKDSEADHRHRILRVVKSLVTRVKELVRIAARDSKKTFVDVSNNALTSCEDLSRSIYTWLGDVCLSNCFPGASYDREVMTLDILCCVLDSSDPACLHLPLLFSPPLTTSILNMLLSSWDKSRHLAADVILKFPRPLSGAATKEAVAALLHWSDQLSGSARQRESDAGAQLIRIVFEIYATDLQWDLDFSPCSSPVISSSDTSSAPVRFLRSVVAVLSSRLEKVAQLFSQTHIGADPSTANAPLCHGLLLGIRYCMSSIVKRTLSSNGNETNEWVALLRETQTLAFRALRIGVAVVAEAPSDVEFAPHLASTLGPVNANSYLFLNTNSFVGATDTADGAEVDPNNRDLQRAIVGAWLLVKEASALTSRLVEASVRIRDAIDITILSVSEIDEIGQSFSLSLGRLKHMGAISEVHSSLQKTAEVLIRQGFYDTSLCDLPVKWMQTLLGRLESQQQVFILRRSSGFAFSFLSLLRAEVSDSKPFMLSLAMQHLLSNAVDKDPYSDCDSSDLWRQSVHSLNIIRLILLDASLGPNLDPYIASITELAVKGFKSKKWAIRNSSMMVFSALVQRSVANEKNDYSNIHAASPNDFFNSYPSLFPFLVGELRNAVDLATDVVVRTDQKAYLDILYPLLLLLSKLRPETVPIEELGVGAASFSFDVKAFLLPIESCSSFPDIYIRTIAAKAFKSLVPMNCIPTEMRRITSAMSLLLNQNSNLNMNELHGKAQLLFELTDSFKTNSVLLKAHGATYSQVIECFMNDAFPSFEELCIKYLSLVFIETAHALPVCAPVLQTLLLTSKGFTTILEDVRTKRLLLLLTSGVMSAVKTGDSMFLSTHCTPFTPILLRSSADSMVCLYFDPSLSDVRLFSFEAILQLLRHQIPEVREGILDGLLTVLSVEKLPGYEESSVLCAVVDSITNEIQAPLQEKCLKTLELLSKTVTYSILGVEFDMAFTTKTLMEKLARLLFEGDAVYSLVYGEMASMIKSQRPELRRTDSAAYIFSLVMWRLRTLATNEHLMDVMALMELAVQDEVADSLRLAAAESWSTVLKMLKATSFTSKTDKGEYLCKLWLMALDIIQDDAEDVRNAIVIQLNEFVNSKRDADSEEWKDLLPNENRIVTDIAEVIVSDLRPFQPTYLQNLIDFYYKQFLNIEVLKDLTGEGEDGTSRIFEEEMTNLFKEQKVILEVLTPVIADTFDRMFTTTNHSLHASSHNILDSVLDKAIDSLRVYTEATKVLWIGDISYQKDMFIHVFGCCILAKTMVSCFLKHNVLHVSLLRDKCGEFLTLGESSCRMLHPLIARIFSDDE